MTSSSPRYNSTPSSSSFRRASKVAEGIGHGVIAGTSVVSSSVPSSSSSLLNLKSLKEKVSQGLTSLKSSDATSSSMSSSSTSGVAQAMAASAVAAVAATAATSRSASVEGRSSANRRKSSFAVAPSLSKEKAKLSSQSSLTNDQLTAHLTDEERNILEKVFLKEEEFHRQEASSGNYSKSMTRRFSTRPSMTISDASAMSMGMSSSGQQRSVDNMAVNSPLESPSSSSCASGTNTSTTSPSLIGCCRVCRKQIEINENHYYCDTCNQPVCEDCSSYTNVSDGDVSTTSFFCQLKSLSF